ncbi:MAG: molecular chaperone HtpG [Clostridia bacterium]|nr:molecular chaperone HtpG [Clostridia bacterium]
MKQFKAESKRLLDLMINSIYTNKEIFLRELISNASDAIDKLYYKSLTDKNINISREDFFIKIDIDKENRSLKISDNGIGMTEEELENNLGTIAKSGSLAFKEENEKKDNIDIIGQFGVGFYSAFMVSDSITVNSKSYLTKDKAYSWTSKGAEGYKIEEIQKENIGTEIIMHIKENTEEENYSDFLEDFRIKEIVKKYSDYIPYPIKMEVIHQRKKENVENEYEEYVEEETLNSRIPLWKRNKTEITEDEYNSFYIDNFSDYEKPLKVIHSFVEGGFSYNSLLFIPSHLPYNYYGKDTEKGLKLYSNGVLIMEKCEELLPDYFGFVKGLVDSQDLSLNISREMLQHDRQLRVIAKSLEKKINSELKIMINEKREEYEKFFANFGLQLKFGVYNDFGINKDSLQDLLLFYSSKEKKLVTLKEYVARMKEEQKNIYYACGESIEKIDLLPQVEAVKEKGFEILYLTENVDEFVIQTIMEYDKKTFINVSADKLDLSSEEEKAELEKANKDSKEMFEKMKDALGGEVQEVRFTNRLKNHPVCLTSEGPISVEMEKVINSMPNDQKVKAKLVLEINEKHKIVDKLKELNSKEDKEALNKYTKVLYSQARLIEGLSLENPTEISNIICDIMSK